MDENIITDEVFTRGAFEYRAAVHYDPYPDMTESPREWDNLAHLCLSHRRYDLPFEDVTGIVDTDRDLRVTMRFLSSRCDAVVLPVWGYEHGQLALTAGTRSGQFADRWDSGLAGIAYMFRSVAKANMARPDDGDWDSAIERAIQDEVETYDKWARGEVTFYTAAKRPAGSDDEWDEFDSCHGFIGEEDYPLSEAKAACKSEADDDEATAKAKAEQAASDQEEIDDLMRTELGAFAV